MKSRGRASSAFFPALAGLLIGAALVWIVLHVGSPAGTRATATTSGKTLPPAVSADSQDAITAAVKKVGPAVVNISVIFQPSQEDVMRQMLGMPTEPFPRAGQGSGVIIDGMNGYILTNAHVVKGAQKVMVTMSDGKRLEAQVRGVDPLTEVAVVQVAGGNLPQAELGRADALPIGAWVIAIGNPFGFENSVTVGVLSAKNRQIASPDAFALSDLLQTDASINPGNSGGALVDLNGSLIGMPTAVIPYAQGIGFAVSIDVAKQVADRLIATGKMPWLGVEHRALSPEEAKQLGLSDTKGSMVFGVYPNGPAAQGGLQPGDLIVAIAGEPVVDDSSLSRAIRAHDAGEQVDITIIRKGREQTLRVTLGAVPVQLGRR